MRNIEMTPAIGAELRAIFVAGEKALAGAGLAIVGLLAVAASNGSLAAPGLATAVTSIVVAAGGYTAARAGSAYARCMFADASGWHVAGLLLGAALLTTFFAFGAAFSAVEMLDAHHEEFGTKAQQNTLRIVIAAAFWGGAGVSFTITSLGLQARRVYSSLRERASFGALVLIVSGLAYVFVSAWMAIR